MTTIFIVLFSHDGKDEIAARYKLLDAETLLGRLMSETLADLERKIDGDRDGLESLKELKGHIANNRMNKGVLLFNALNEYYYDCDSERHYARIEEVLAQ